MSSIYLDLRLLVSFMICQTKNQYLFVCFFSYEPEPWEVNSPWWSSLSLAIQGQTYGNPPPNENCYDIIAGMWDHTDENYHLNNRTVLNNLTTEASWDWLVFSSFFKPKTPVICPTFIFVQHLKNTLHKWTFANEYGCYLSVLLRRHIPLSEMNTSVTGFQ